MKSAKDANAKWSEVVKVVKGTRQKEQRGAEPLFFSFSIMLLTQVTQNSCPHPVFSEHFCSQQIKHSATSTFSLLEVSSTSEMFFAWSRPRRVPGGT